MKKNPWFLKKIIKIIVVKVIKLIIEIFCDMA